tara:strand:+ start:840 stop:1232 length:393 start_codon:yes stop_codon:yes gene_type:complete
MNRNAPEEIVYHKIGHTLEIAWPDARFDLPAELLRVCSPSAEVRGHSEQERVLQTGKKNVGIKAIEAIGNYAIRITFDDGHDSGIFAWDYLYELGNNQAQHWQDYLSDLKQANASRLPTIPVGQWQPNKS